MAIAICADYAAARWTLLVVVMASTIAVHVYGRYEDRKWTCFLTNVLCNFC